MRDNLIFCLNATMPIFAVMLIGMLLRKTGRFSKEFAAKMNSYVFKVALPVLLFYDMGSKDFYKVWNTKFVLFCFLGSAASIAMIAALSFLIKQREERGEFIQSSYRSSAAILGTTLAQNVYGNAGMVPLMILGAVPLYNVVAVEALVLTAPNGVGTGVDAEGAGGEAGKIDSASLKRSFKSIAKNPIILGILAGLIWSLLKLPMPLILDRTLESISRTATPAGLLALGASFELSKAKGSMRAALSSSFIKLFGLGLIFLPIAVRMGFRNEELMAAVVMCCSPTTVTSYVMAREFGHEGTLSALTVMITTLVSAFSFALWLFVLRGRGLM